MLGTLTTLLERVARWPILLGLIGVYVALSVVTFSQVARFQQATDGAALLELPTLAPERYYPTAQAYAPEGLRIYQTVIQPLDILLPLSIGLVFALALAMLTTHLFPTGSPWRALPLLGLLATLLDWLENLGVFFILRTLDGPVEWLPALTRTFILSKTVVATLPLVAIVALLAVLASRRLRARRARVTS